MTILVDDRYAEAQNRHARSGYKDLQTQFAHEFGPKEGRELLDMILAGVELPTERAAETQVPVAKAGHGIRRR